jgi:sugar phosphate isomerase/epimerase
VKLSIVLSTHAAQFQAVALKGDFESNVAKIASWGYAIDRTKSHIPFAAQTGAAIIIGLLRGIVRPGVDHAQAMDWLVAALQECCAAAQHHGVRIALEPITRYETTLINNLAQGLDLLERVGAENMGLMPDSFHMNIEEPDIEESIRACGDRIFHFHVADSNRWYPGAGHLDFRSILKALYATGYEGYVSGEFMPLPDADTSAQKGIAYLRQHVLADLPLLG